VKTEKPHLHRYYGVWCVLTHCDRFNAKLLADAMAWARERNNISHKLDLRYNEKRHG
jgi:hypothetical protein